MPQNTPGLADFLVGLIGSVVVVVIVATLVIWLSGGRETGRDDGSHAASDPCDGAARELTLDEAERFVSLLEATPEPTVSKHCPACIIAMCDEWGISLDAVRTVGPARYCREHKHSILARARQGA